MMFLALLVLLTDSVVKVPAAHWIAIELKVLQNGTTVHVSYEVQKSSARVQAIVLTRREAERLNLGRRHIEALAESGFSSSGRLRVLIPDAGDYVLILDNRFENRFPTEVALRVEMTNSSDVRVGVVPPARRHATVALSLLFFGAVVVLSAVKFLRSQRTL